MCRTGDASRRWTLSSDIGIVDVSNDSERGKFTRQIARGARASPSLPKTNFDFAVRAFWLESQVDRTTELVRNEIADEA